MLLRAPPLNPPGSHSHPIFLHSVLNVLITATSMLPFRMSSPCAAYPPASRCSSASRRQRPQIWHHAPSLSRPTPSKSRNFFFLIRLRTLASSGKPISFVFNHLPTLGAKTPGVAYPEPARPSKRPPRSESSTSFTSSTSYTSLTRAIFLSASKGLIA
jgi:hypothetical protein